MIKNQKRGSKFHPYANPNKKGGTSKSDKDKGNKTLLGPRTRTLFFGAKNKESTPTPSPPLPPSPTASNQTNLPNIILFPRPGPEEKISPTSPFNTQPFGAKQSPPTLPTPPVATISPQHLTLTAAATQHRQPQSSKGICDKMCPDVYADIDNYNKIFEVGPDGKPDRELFIVKNPRSTSDRTYDPPSVRSEIGLRRTYDRIRNDIIPFDKNVDNGPLWQIFQYLNQILTSLSKDAHLTIHYSQLSIDILEFSIRFCNF